MEGSLRILFAVRRFDGPKSVYNPPLDVEPLCRGCIEEFMKKGYNRFMNPGGHGWQRSIGVPEMGFVPSKERRRLAKPIGE